MKNIFTLTVLLILTGCATIHNREWAALRFDGVYQSEKMDDCWSYLRFYPDHTVISVTSTGRPADLRRWFNKKEQASLGVATANVKIKGNRVSLSPLSRGETMEGHGEVKGDLIYWDSLNHRGTGCACPHESALKHGASTNTHQTKNVYTFCNW